MRQGSINRYGALNPASKHCCCAYTWPGNVRELSALMERPVTLASANVIVACAEVAAALEPQPEAMFGLGGMSLKGNKRDAITEAFHRHNGNRGRMAADLGMHRTTLWRQIKTFCPELAGG